MLKESINIIILILSAVILLGFSIVGSIAIILK